MADLFDHFGGHEFACGFSLRTANVDELRRRLEGQFDQLDPLLFRRVASVDATLTLAEIDRALIDGHEMLQPFGAGNPQPLFTTRGVTIVSRREFAPDCVELLVTDSSAEATAVLWPSAAALRESVGNGHAVDLLVQLEPAPQLKSGVRLTIVDVRNSAEG